MSGQLATVLPWRATFVLISTLTVTGTSQHYNGVTLSSLSYNLKQTIDKLVKAPTPADLRAVPGVCPLHPLRIKTHLDNALYLSSLWSDLSM